MKFSMRNVVRATLPALALAELTACGGGSSSPPPTYSIGGTVSGLKASHFVSIVPAGEH